jgi:hypothetical protein
MPNKRFHEDSIADVAASMIRTDSRALFSLCNGFQSSSFLFPGVRKFSVRNAIPGWLQFLDLQPNTFGASSVAARLCPGCSPGPLADQIVELKNAEHGSGHCQKLMDFLDGAGFRIQAGACQSILDGISFSRAIGELELRREGRLRRPLAVLRRVPMSQCGTSRQEQNCECRTPPGVTLGATTMLEVAELLERKRKLLDLRQEAEPEHRGAVERELHQIDEALTLQKETPPTAPI